MSYPEKIELNESQDTQTNFECIVHNSVCDKFAAEINRRCEFKNLGPILSDLEEYENTQTKVDILTKHFLSGLPEPVKGENENRN